MLLFPQRDQVNGGLGQGIMATYSVVGLFLLTILGVLFLISFFKKSYKSIEILAWLMVIGNSFVVFGILSFIISTILQKI